MHLVALAGAVPGVGADPSAPEWANRIVRDTYSKVWQPLRSKCNGSQYSSVVQQDWCMARHAQRSGPWWAITLLNRSLRHFGGEGSNHGHAIKMDVGGNKHLAFCRLPKVDSSRWAAVHLKADHSARSGGFAPDMTAAQFRARHRRPGWITAVFLRDPLERFLSAFVDKCVNAMRVRDERHCEPREVFAKGMDSTLMKQLQPNWREPSRDVTPAAIEAYADVMPVQWNLHFVPQALMCGHLGLSVNLVSYVGVMNSTYLQQVQQLRHIANPSNGAESSLLQDSIRDVFLQHPSRKRVTRTSHKATRLFSRAAAERLLMLYAVDYVELSLPLPRWLHALK